LPDICTRARKSQLRAVRHLAHHLGLRGRVDRLSCCLDTREEGAQSFRDAAQGEAQRVAGQIGERYDGFVEALGRRLARGRKLADEISSDIDAAGSGSDAEP
jgi:hypothetical protein